MLVVPIPIKYVYTKRVALQVHHRNHDTQDNRLSNLISVCAACHLNLHRGRYSSVSPGQLKLF